MVEDLEDENKLESTPEGEALGYIFPFQTQGFMTLLVEGKLIKGPLV